MVGRRGHVVIYTLIALRPSSREYLTALSTAFRACAYIRTWYRTAGSSSPVKYFQATCGEIEHLEAAAGVSLKFGFSWFRQVALSHENELQTIRVNL